MKATPKHIDRALFWLTEAKQLAKYPSSVVSALLTVAQQIDKQGYRRAMPYTLAFFRVTFESEKEVELFANYLRHHTGVAFWIRKVTMHTSPPPSLLGEIDDPRVEKCTPTCEYEVMVYPGVYLDAVHYEKPVATATAAD